MLLPIDRVLTPSFPKIPLQEAMLTTLGLKLHKLMIKANMPNML
jgi:hypothetical protein